MRNRDYRRKMKKKKDIRLRNIITTVGYAPFAGYIDCDNINGRWEITGKYIKYCKNSNRQRFYKKHSNRIVRKSDVPHKGNGYRKYFDYWWEMD